MLCTPPAFILSQDQTLENIVSYHPKVLKSYSRAFVALLLLLCLSSISQFELFEFTSHFVFALYFSLRCSIFNDRFVSASLFSRGDLNIISQRFSFVNTFFHFFCIFLFSFQTLFIRALDYFTTLLSFCQALF